MGHHKDLLLSNAISESRKFLFMYLSKATINQLFLIKDSFHCAILICILVEGIIKISISVPITKLLSQKKCKSNIYIFDSTFDVILLQIHNIAI